MAGIVISFPPRVRVTSKIALSIFARKLEPGIGTWSSRVRGTGCRGIVGPVAPPLLMEVRETRCNFRRRQLRSIKKFLHGANRLINNEERAPQQRTLQPSYSRIL